MSKLNPQDRETLDKFKGMTVGQIFTRARSHLGYSIEQVGVHLNIGTTHLEAIEADDTANLPPKVYAVGFVRAYADVLGLDSEKMAYLFKVQSYGNAQVAQHQQMTRRQGETIGAADILKTRMEDLPAALGSLVIILLALGIGVLVLWTLVWLVWPRSGGEQTLAVPPVPEEIVRPMPVEPPVEEVVETAPQPAPTEPTDIVVKPDEGMASYGGEALTSPLVFKAVGESWVDIRAVDDGRILLTRTLKKGEVFYTPADTDILLTTGNAAGLEMYLDGRSLGVLGGQGEIIRLRPFSAKALRLQNTPQPE